MGKAVICIVFLACVIFPIQNVFAQSGVGIGTSNPNPNAALDIQSAANDKGILIPRLTSAQRLAMVGTLSANENGLLVFDSDLNAFYYWNASIWTSISVIQDLQLVGNILTITNNGSATNIDLSPFSGTNTDNQDLSSSSSLNNRTINITGGTGTTFNVADNDNNVTNELQTISKAGSTVTLSIGGGSFTDAVNDADANATNELQTISKVGSTVILSNGGGSFTDAVNDADANATNELQTISKVGSTVTLSNGGGTFTDAVNDGDADAKNELQTLSVAGSTLSISGGNSVNLPASGGTKEAFKVYLNKNTPYTEGYRQIIFDATQYDLNKSYDVAKGIFRAPVNGIYHFTGSVIIELLSAIPFQLDFIDEGNGNAYHYKRVYPDATWANQPVTVSFSFDVQLNAGTGITFFIDCPSTDFQLFGAGEALSNFSGVLVVEL